jgi:hypothetical protein
MKFKPTTLEEANECIEKYGKKDPHRIFVIKDMLKFADQFETKHQDDITHRVNRLLFIAGNMRKYKGTIKGLNVEEFLKTAKGVSGEGPDFHFEPDDTKNSGN